MISDAFQVNWCCEHSHLPHNYSVIFFILFHVFTDLSLFVLGLKSLFGIWEPWPLCIKENKCHCLCLRSLRWNKAEVPPPHEEKILPRQDTHILAQTHILWLCWQRQACWLCAASLSLLVYMISNFPTSRARTMHPRFPVFTSLLCKFPNLPQTEPYCHPSMNHYIYAGLVADWGDGWWGGHKPQSVLEFHV